MNKPKMILFDYGQTLVNQQKLDGIKGTEAVLKYAVKNKYNLSASQVQAEVGEINKELGRSDPATRHLFHIEVPNHMFTAYLYESLGIRLSLTPEQIDKVFWDNAAPGVPTDIPGVSEPKWDSHGGDKQHHLCGENSGKQNQRDNSRKSF